MISCCVIRTRCVCVIFSRPSLSLTCLEQSYLRHLMALSRLGVPTRHRYLTPSLSAAMSTTCDASPTGKQVQLFPLIIHALRVSLDPGWVASGSFDRTIKLWDLPRASQAATAPPLMSFYTPGIVRRQVVNICACGRSPRAYNCVWRSGSCHPYVGSSCEQAPWQARRSH